MHPLSQVYTAPVAPSTDNTTSTSPNAIVDCSDEARKNGLTTQSDTNIPSPSGVSSHSATPSLIAGSRDGDHSDNVDSQPATSPVTPSPEMIIIPDDDDKDNTAGLGTQSDMTKEPDTITIDDSDSDDGSLFGDPIEESDEDPAATDKKGKGKANVKMSIDEEFDEDFDEGSDGDSDEVNQTPMTQARNLSARDLKGMDAPEAMSCTLLPHQRIGLEWLLNHETGPLKGSCLADDMGLGKTIQALALIHANPPRDPERCKTTLIVAPLALLQQWPREIADKTKPGHKLSVHVFHGRGREINRRALMRYDVVLTNYDTLCAEYGLTQTKKKGLTLLHPDTWFHRVILDEAHKIKNRRAQTSQGAWRLQTDFRLCMTGTPMMNDPEELYGIVRFLQLKDYSDWSYFDARIAKPLGKAKDFGRAPPEEAMREVRKVVDMTMLVRKKTDLLDGKPMITLPGRTDTVEYCIFDEDEQAFYDKLEEKTQKEVAKFQKAYKGTANFAVMLVQLLRMRQACCHPILLAYGTEKPTTDGGSSDEDGNPPAAAAKKPRGKPQTKNAEYYREIEDDYLPSAKIKKTLEILANIREKSPEEKVIVFSFFTSFLDILAIGMAKEGFVYRRYDGTLNVAKKDVVIRDFIDPNSRTRILLTSLQSGNAGLNLNIANHVIIEEPYWNPYIEAQAIDRAHRIGQTKEVHVHRLLVKNTVEDKIMALQEKKKRMVGMALGTYSDGDGSNEQQKMGGLTKQDLLGLLGPSNKPSGEMAAAMSGFSQLMEARPSQAGNGAVPMYGDYSSVSGVRSTPAGSSAYTFPDAGFASNGSPVQDNAMTYTGLPIGAADDSSSTSMSKKRPAEDDFAGASTLQRPAKRVLWNELTPEQIAARKSKSKAKSSVQSSAQTASSTHAQTPSTLAATVSSQRPVSRGGSAQAVPVRAAPPVRLFHGATNQRTAAQSASAQSAASRGGTQGPSTQRPSAQGASQGPSTQRPSTQSAARGPSTQRASAQGTTGRQPGQVSTSTRRPANSVQSTVQTPDYAKRDESQNPGDATNWGSLLSKYNRKW